MRLKGQAGDFFQAQVEAVKDDKIRLNDAYLRLGDCRFVTAKYWPAMDAYNKVIDMKSVDADYAAFQKGISYGFVNKPERKMEEFEKFSRTYTKSQYIDDALYELGNTYVNQTLNEKALLTYDDLIANHTSSSYVAKAILKQGLIYYNGNKEEQAKQVSQLMAARFNDPTEYQL